MEDPPYQPRLGLRQHVWRAAIVLAFSGFLILTRAEIPQASIYRQLVVLDVLTGLVAFVLVHWRRRWPLPVAVTLNVVSTWSLLAAGPALLATVSLATRRVWREICVIFLVVMAAGEVQFRIWPGDPATPPLMATAFNLLLTAALLAWGMFVGSRRELVWTLAERAERAEAERDARVAAARSTERTRIAREMHDVLAHRISQVSMHAGALAFREDLPAAELRSGAREIQVKANAALEDLRGLLGVLRDPLTGELADSPQPTYGDVAALVEEFRSTGLEVVVDTDVDGHVPTDLGRTIYRIVQETLTNAAKHAPSSSVSVGLSGGPTTGIEFRVSNPTGFPALAGGRDRGGSAAPTDTPGAGLGLVGLAERVALRGGRLQHRQRDGQFIVEGWLPWDG